MTTDCPATAALPLPSIPDEIDETASAVCQLLPNSALLPRLKELFATMALEFAEVLQLLRLKQQTVPALAKFEQQICDFRRLKVQGPFSDYLSSDLCRSHLSRADRFEVRLIAYVVSSAAAQQDRVGAAAERAEQSGRRLHAAGRKPPRPKGGAEARRRVRELSSRLTRRKSWRATAASSSGPSTT